MKICLGAFTVVCSFKAQLRVPWRAADIKVFLTDEVDMAVDELNSGQITKREQARHDAAKLRLQKHA
jgi:hypothetical protein